MQQRHTSFVPAWVKDAIFYQIFPERFANGDPSNDPPGTEAWGGTPTPRNYFGGDLRGIIQHLEYLSSLGINALYLNPVFVSNSNHKYQTVDYMRIDPQFGDESTFVELINSCHARKIRVILDGVFNHTGVGFFAFADVKKNGASSRYKDWYFFKSLPVGPVNRPNYACWWDYGSLPKLNTANPAVREYLYGVTRHWMALGVDGWRLDVPNEIPHEFWQEWRRLVKSINPDAYIVGEIWEDGSPWLKGEEFDAVMNYRFRSACSDFFAGKKSTASEFDSALAMQRSDYGPEVSMALLNLLGSHDTERFLTICKGDTGAWRLAVLFQMTYVGAPMIYYGDEVGMTGGKDPGCRGTMEWDASRQEKDMLEFVRQAVALRNAHPSLRGGSFDSLLPGQASDIYAFTRRSPSESIVVALNRGKRERPVLLPPLPRGNSWKRLWPELRGDAPSVRSGAMTTVAAGAGVVYIRVGEE